MTICLMASALCVTTFAAESTDENRLRLGSEIDCVVARKGQKHHAELKRYFITPKSEGAYLVADWYARYIASFAENGALDVERIRPASYYRENSKIVQRHYQLHKNYDGVKNEGCLRR